LPTPPSPVMVTSRLSSASSAVTSWLTSRSLPMRGVIGRGTLEPRCPAILFGPRAAFRKAALSVSVRPRATLSRAAVSAYARARTPRSMSLIVRALTPARSASSSCVSRACSRCRRSSLPSGDINLMLVVRQVGDLLFLFCNPRGHDDEVHGLSPAVRKGGNHGYRWQQGPRTSAVHLDQRRTSWSSGHPHLPGLYRA